MSRNYEAVAEASRREYQAWREAGETDGGLIEVWPNGWYPARIVAVKDGLVPKSGDGMMMRLDIKVKHPEGRYKTLRTWKLYEHSNVMARTIGRQFLGGLTEISGHANPEEWIGERVEVRLKAPKEPVNAQGYTNDNDITGVRASAGKAPPAPPPPSVEVVGIDDDDDVPF